MEHLTTDQEVCILFFKFISPFYMFSPKKLECFIRLAYNCKLDIYIYIYKGVSINKYLYLQCSPLISLFALNFWSGKKQWLRIQFLYLLLGHKLSSSFFLLVVCGVVIRIMTINTRIRYVDLLKLVLVCFIIVGTIGQ